MRNEYGFEWGYDGQGDYFWLDIGSRQIKFTFENSLYTYDPSDDYEVKNMFNTFIAKR